MKTKIMIAFSLLGLLTLTSVAQTDSMYFGQTPPGDTPKIFLNGAGDRIAISPDGKEIYVDGSDGLYYYKYSNNSWKGPHLLFSNYGYPALSPDGKKMFIHKLDNKDAFLSIKNDTGWNTPSRFWNSSVTQFYLQLTDFGNYYLVTDPHVSVNGDIAKLIISGSDTTIQSLGIPINGYNGINFYISHNEKYIIFPIKDNSGTGLGALYISYHKTDGSWTNPKYLGGSINVSGNWEYGPYVTNDDKYLFYTSYPGGNNPTNIYWVKVDMLIDSLKNTNFAPYLKTQLPNQSVTIGHLFNYTVPDSTFIDDDGNNTLTYSAKLSNGHSLPAWLLFDPATRTFSGTPDTIAALTIIITATDTANASASCQFRITIVAGPTGVKEDNGQLPKESILFQNYPNPFNPSTTIRYSLAKSSFVRLNIYNLLGQNVRTLQNAFRTAGEYSVVWDAIDENNTPVSSGIYFYRIQTEQSVLQKKMILIK